MSKAPGIASVPILGELFRSKNFNHSVVDLVIIVTATVVDPLTSSAQAEPSQPKLAVPNLDADAFDAWAHSKPEAGIASPTPTSAPTPMQGSAPTTVPTQANQPNAQAGVDRQ
jgi:Flp pilus assembly secretin CpaC